MALQSLSICAVQENAVAAGKLRRNMNPLMLPHALTLSIMSQVMFYLPKQCGISRISLFWFHTLCCVFGGYLAYSRGEPVECREGEQLWECTYCNEKQTGGTLGRYCCPQVCFGFLSHPCGLQTHEYLNRRGTSSKHQSNPHLFNYCLQIWNVQPTAASDESKYCSWQCPWILQTMWTTTQLKTAPKWLADLQQSKVTGYIFSDTGLGRNS